MAREKINEDLILKAATLYYSHGLTQEKIAKKMGFSRPSVVRMLKQARDPRHGRDLHHAGIAEDGPAGNPD